MAAPTAGTWKEAGSGGFSAQPAIVTWTTDSTESAVVIDLGFAPSFAVLRDVSNNNSFYYYAGLTDAHAVTMDDGADVTSTGFTLVEVADGAVANGSFYIRNNTVVTSDGTDNDVCTGLTIGVSLTVNSAAMVLIAWP